jgi:hypothetical protein
MHCCFLNLLNMQLDINFIQSDIKNLGWRGNNLQAQPPALFVFFFFFFFFFFINNNLLKVKDAPLCLYS